jgi:hypothetical protein
MNDGDIDYSGYSAEELDEALASIRRDLYPLNYQNLLVARALMAALEREESSGAGEPRQPRDPWPSRRVRTAVFGSGALVLLGGIALCVGLRDRYESLPNFLRVASLIPVTLGAMMLSVNTFNDWDRPPPETRGRATFLAMIVLLEIFGALAWLLFAPTARS